MKWRRPRPTGGAGVRSARRAGRLAGVVWVLGMMLAVPATACPANANLTARDLLGRWQAEFTGGSPASLVLERNPEWPGSIAGQLRREGREARVAGDLEDGTFTPEESADGVPIDAVWVGQPAEGRCCQEIRASPAFSARVRGGACGRPGDRPRIRVATGHGLVGPGADRAHQEANRRLTGPEQSQLGAEPWHATGNSGCRVHRGPHPTPLERFIHVSNCRP